MKARITAALAVAALIFLGILITSRVNRIPLDSPPHRVSQAQPEAIAPSAPPATGDPQDPASPFAGAPVVSEETSVNAEGEAVRVRVVKTTFKHPLLRVESVIGKDPLTGAESIRLKTIMVADHLLVKTNPGIAPADFQAMLGRIGATVLRRIPNSDLYLLHFPTAETGTVPDAMKALAREGKVLKYAEPDYVVHTCGTPDDSRFSELWGMSNTGQTGGHPDSDIDAPEAWDLATGSHDLLVGVIDSGIAYDHPDLAANLWHNPGEIEGNGIDDDGNGYVDDVVGWNFYDPHATPYDDNFHGTHVAGTIGAAGNNGQGVAGVCWNVSLAALKFISADGWGYTSDAAEAVRYATSIGANLTSNSWGGGGYSQALKDAIDEADAAGILFVASAGNSGVDIDHIPTYPCGYSSPNIISVAATDSSDHLASFSNRGALGVDLAAPGVGILSTIPGGYTSFNGTSMAAPHVAGACALLWSYHPELGHRELKDTLLASVDDLAALDGVVRTGGRLNVHKALESSLSASPTTLAEFTGLTSGPFSPATRTITLTNRGSTPAVWSATTPAPWLELTSPGGWLGSAEGEIPPGGTAEVVVSIKPAAATYPSGVRETIVEITNASADDTIRLPVSLVIHDVVELSPAGFATAGEQGGPFRIREQEIQLGNHTGAPLDWRASISSDGPWATWVDCDPPGGRVADGQTSPFTLKLNDDASLLPPGVHTAAVTLTFAPGGDTRVIPVTLTVGEDHHTEFVDAAANNRSFHVFTFTPAGSGYTVTQAPAYYFPFSNTAPALSIPDNGSVEVPLTDGAVIPFHGQNYSSFNISSNGCITFGAGDSAALPTLDAHFSLPRIAALFCDLNPELGGQVKRWQFYDRAAVSFENVPENWDGGSNTFMVEMFFNGRIRITLLAESAKHALLGLSPGGGVPVDFYESDFSSYPPSPADFDYGPYSMHARAGTPVWLSLQVNFSFPIVAQPLSWIWRHNGVPIPGTENRVNHGISSVQVSDAGTYDAVATTADGAVSHSPPGVLTVDADRISNGSFENSLAGWSASGNVVVQSAPPYAGTDGTSVLAFNSGNTAPNGVIRQAMSCIPLTGYRLEFDVGVLSYNTAEQRLQLSVNSFLNPINETITVAGTGGGSIRWIHKSYDVLSPGDEWPLYVTFRDVSASTANLDLLLDHVRLSEIQRLHVTSLPLAAGSGIAVSQPDIYGNGGGTAPLSLRYLEDTQLTLSAQTAPPGYQFVKWANVTMSGSDIQVGTELGTSPDLPVTISGFSKRVAAVYTSVNPPTVTGPASATCIAGLPFSTEIGATGYPTSYQADGLPAGLALAGSVISGVPEQPGVFAITLHAGNPSGTASGTLTLTVRPAPSDHFTEIFGDTANDTAFQTFTFTPDNSSAGYSVTRRRATAFPIDPAGAGWQVTLGDDRIFPQNGATVPFFGESFDSLTVYRNGCVGFGDSAYGGRPTTLGEHLAIREICALFRSLSPSTGQITWRQTADRLAVTWSHVRQIDPYQSAAGDNNLQIELFFDGRIRITVLGITASDGLIGLSRGVGMPANFVESDFSEYPLDDGFAVTPNEPFVASGPQGGPFPTASKSYLLENHGEAAMDWTASSASGWLGISSPGGRLEPGTSAELNVSVSATAANDLAVGSHHGTLVISTTEGEFSRDASLTVNPIPPVITGPLEAAGRQGFPFTCQIAAANGPTTYAATPLPAGLSIDTASGLISGTPTGHGVFVANLSAGNAAGTGTATLTITIEPLPASVYSASLDSDPGWQRQGEWAFGVPTGAGGSLQGNPDPAAGATGANVFGINLAGDYSLAPGGPFYLTAGPYDLSACDSTVLKFQQWLNFDLQPWASATLEISVDGTNWTQIWSNPTSALTDSAWHEMVFDIASIADHQPAVYLRWGYRIDGGALAYSGWNIDDVEILANSPLIVTTPLDENDGALGLGAGDSLREIIAEAGQRPGADVIHFSPGLDGASIVLGGTHIVINSDLVIDASDLPGGLIVSGNGASRAFHVTAGAEVGMRGFTLTGGVTGVAPPGEFGSASGAAILNDGFSSLTLTDMVIRGNTTDDDGGALSNRDSWLTANRCTLTNNHAAGDGGAVFTWVFSYTTIIDSEISENTCGSDGGGISSNFHLTLSGTTIMNNHAGGSGGGIRSFNPHPAGGVLVISNSTLASNTAQSSGGAIVFANSLTLENSTVTANSAGAAGGGVSALLFATPHLTNSIVAANTATVSPDIAASDTQQSGVNFIGGDPRLAPLDQYGGLTPTRPPLPGSPVIDAAILLETTSATDQRGAMRPTGPLPDIGAVEAFPFSMLSLVDSDNDGIDDRLEPAYGLTVGTDDSTRDSDGDGSDDAEEISNMTDPLDPNSSLKITSFTPAPGFDAADPQFDLSFASFPGLSYTLEFSQGLDFSGSSLREQSFGMASAHTTTVRVILAPPRDFVRIRRER